FLHLHKEERGGIDRLASVRREGKANSMAGGRESNKQHAADDSDPHRQARQNLLRLFRRYREEAGHHVLVEQRHRRKHQNGHQRVGQVDEPDPVSGRDRRRERLGAVDNPQSPECGQPIPHRAVAVSEAVGETEDEAGEAADGHEALGHQPVHRHAVASVGEDGGEELEGEHGAGGEQLGEMGGALEGLADGFLDEGRLIIAGRIRSQERLLLLL
ncbi:unnamed protein product, partial [Musa textilis]